MLFIKRIHKYAVKTLKTGAARVFIQNRDALKRSGLPANTRFNVIYAKHTITIIPCKNGANKIMDTGRGELLELKNKDTFKAIGDLGFVTVTFKRGKVVISVNYRDKLKMEREKSIFDALSNGAAIRTASFFSGLGMLAYHIKKGLEEAGIRSTMTFANDSSALAMALNLEANPIWENASKDAFAVIDDLENLDISQLMRSHVAEVGYPCLGQTKMCTKENRDLNHPMVGTLFIKLLAALEKMNPAMVVFENTPSFMNSQTLKMIKREMHGYRFEEVMLNANEHGDIEGRPRACIIAISEGLPKMGLESFTSPSSSPIPVLSDYLENIPPDSPLWREMAHVKRKEQQASLNYKNMLYHGHENKIATICASYGAPKIGAPMIIHPANPNLQRQLTVFEHAKIRDLPEKLFNLVMDVNDGRHQLVNKSGSMTAGHRLLGNGVSSKVWTNIGRAIGLYLQNEVSAKSGQFDFSQAA